MKGKQKEILVSRGLFLLSLVGSFDGFSLEKKELFEETKAAFRQKSFRNSRIQTISNVFVIKRQNSQPLKNSHT